MLLRPNAKAVVAPSSVLEICGTYQRSFACLPAPDLSQPELAACCPPGPPNRPGQQSSLPLSTHYILHCNQWQISLFMYFSLLSVIFPASKVLTKGTILEIKLNPTRIMVMDFPRTLKFAWLQFKKLGSTMCIM